jgi:hypothetical protein
LLQIDVKAANAGKTFALVKPDPVVFYPPLQDEYPVKVIDIPGGLYRV